MHPFWESELRLFLKKLIFMVQKRLASEKLSMFDGKYDAIKIKQFS